METVAGAAAPLLGFVYRSSTKLLAGNGALDMACEPQPVGELAEAMEQHYRELKLPVVILTGGDDQIVDVGRQSRRLHEEIPQSELIVLPGLGHMIHHLAPDEVIRAVDRAAELAGVTSRSQHPAGFGSGHEFRVAAE